MATQINKICKKCNQSKVLEEFPIHSIVNDKTYYRTLCKVCENEYRSDYKNNHPELKDYYKEYKKKYYQENKIPLLEYQKEYLRIERLNNPARKIRENISRSINYHLNKLNTSKLGSSIKNFLPYTIDELKNHLESQFEPWMTWENYGTYRRDIWDDNDSSTWTWQIDHIIPHSNFKYTSMEDEEFKECWSLNNLRPYSSKQNLLDGLVKTRHNKPR